MGVCVIKQNRLHEELLSTFSFRVLALAAALPHPLTSTQPIFQFLSAVVSPFILGGCLEERGAITYQCHVSTLNR